MLFGLFGKRAAKAPQGGGQAYEAMLAEARDLVARQHFAAAEVHYDRLRAQKPDDAVLANEAGIAAYQAGDFDRAEALFQAAWELAPAYPTALANIGQCQQVRGRFAAAIPMFERALEMDPGHRNARFNLAVASYAVGDSVRAAQICRELIATEPDDPSPHIALGECLLRDEEFEEGWAEYEWRLAAPEYQSFFRRYPQPRWDGSAVDGAVVLVWPEQGFGDTFQFMRLVVQAARDFPGMRFVLEVPSPMLGIAQSAAAGLANLSMVATGSKEPPFTHHISIMSLAYATGASLTRDPCPPPYLRPEPAAVAAWRPRVAAFARGRLTVGLVWAGNRRTQLNASEQAVDVRRSIGAARLAGLLDVPGCAFYSLQVGTRAGELQGPPDVLCDWTAELKDFAATAALIACLDLVVSVDTAVAHMAGALGAPVWMLSRHDCCWRWGRRRASIPWYPGLRPFYQPAPGDWEGVMRDVGAALAERASRGR